MARTTLLGNSQEELRKALEKTPKPYLYFRAKKGPWHPVCSPNGTYGKFKTKEEYAKHLRSKGFQTRIGEEDGRKEYVKPTVTKHEVTKS